MVVFAAYISMKFSNNKCAMDTLLKYTNLNGQAIGFEQGGRESLENTQTMN